MTKMAYIYSCADGQRISKQWPLVASLLLFQSQIDFFSEADHNQNMDMYISGPSPKWIIIVGKMRNKLTFGLLVLTTSCWSWTACTLVDRSIIQQRKIM